MGVSSVSSGETLLFRCDQWEWYRLAWAICVPVKEQHSMGVDLKRYVYSQSSRDSSSISGGQVQETERYVIQGICCLGNLKGAGELGSRPGIRE